MPRFEHQDEEGANERLCRTRVHRNSRPRRDTLARRGLSRAIRTGLRLGVSLGDLCQSRPFRLRFCVGGRELGPERVRSTPNASPRKFRMLPKRAWQVSGVLPQPAIGSDIGVNSWMGWTLCCSTSVKAPAFAPLRNAQTPKVLRLTLLAPDLVETILSGQQPAELQLDSLMRRFPVERYAQRSTFARKPQAEAAKRLHAGPKQRPKQRNRKNFRGKLPSGRCCSRLVCCLC